METKQLIQTDNQGKILYADFLGYIISDNYGRLLTKNGKVAFTYRPKIFKGLAAVLKKVEELNATGNCVYTHREYIKYSYNKPKNPVFV